MAHVKLSLFCFLPNVTSNRLPPIGIGFPEPRTTRLLRHVKFPISEKTVREPRLWGKTQFASTYARTGLYESEKRPTIAPPSISMLPSEAQKYGPL